MTKGHVIRACLLCCLLAPAARAQFPLAAYDTVSPSQTSPVDAGIAVSASRIVLTSNHHIQLFDRAGNQKDLRIRGDVDFPFTGMAGDPQTIYDGANGRIWMMYMGFTPRNIHLAVSVDDAPDTFDADDPATPAQEGDWYYFTGTDAFNLASESIEPEERRFADLPDRPTINADGDYLHFVARDTDQLVAGGTEAVEDGIVSFPLQHQSGSMLDGFRPTEAELEILKLNQLDFLLSAAFPNDDGMLRYAVKEPFEQVADAQFFLCTSEWAQSVASCAEPPCELPRGFYNAVQTELRLGGSYFNASTGRREFIFRDMALPSGAAFFNAGRTNHPETPDPAAAASSTAPCSSAMSTMCSASSPRTPCSRQPSTGTTSRQWTSARCAGT